MGKGNYETKRCQRGRWAAAVFDILNPYKSIGCFHLIFIWAVGVSYMVGKLSFYELVEGQWRNYLCYVAVMCLPHFFTMFLLSDSGWLRRYYQKSRGIKQLLFGLLLLSPCYRITVLLLLMACCGYLDGVGGLILLVLIAVTLALILIEKYTKDRWGMDGLLLAVYHGKITMVDQWIKTYRYSLDTRDKHGRNALLLAAVRGDLAMVDHLIIEHQCDLETRDKDRNNALLLAAYRGNIALLDHLITRYQCSLEVKNAWGNNALLCAVWDGEIGMLDHLITRYQCSLKIKEEEGKNPLLLAAYRGKIAIVDYLITQHQCTLEVKDEWDNNALLCAAWGGSIGMVNHLIRNYQCSLYEKGYGGQNVLLYAASFDQVAVVNHLIKTHKCALDTRDDGGYTLLDILHGKMSPPNGLIDWKRNEKLWDLVVEEGGRLNICVGHDLREEIPSKPARPKH